MQKTLLKNLEQIITDKNSKAIYNDGKIITADKFQYNKNENILNANGNVKVEDKVQNYLILQKTLLIKKSRTIITKGKTNAFIDLKYEFLSNNIELLLNEKLLSSDKKTTIKDNKDQIFKLDSFQYSIKNEELKGKNITYITNWLPESDKLFFLLINLKNQNAVGKDLKFDFHNNLFGNKKFT